MQKSHLTQGGLLDLNLSNKTKWKRFFSVSQQYRGFEAFSFIKNFSGEDFGGQRKKAMTFRAIVSSFQTSSLHLASPVSFSGFTPVDLTVS